MVRFAVGVAMVMVCVGCEGGAAHPRSGLDQRMFGAAAIRIHPTFTQVRDWTGRGKPDGIEATLEVQDQFGEPTRSTGRVMFELYNFRKTSPHVRGSRIGGPWVYQLNTKSQQQERWNSALRAYTFQLPFPQATLDRFYVLTAQFDLNGDAAPAASTSADSQPTTESAAASAPATRPATRLFDQLILEPQNEEKNRGGHIHAPNRTPGH